MLAPPDALVRASEEARLWVRWRQQRDDVARDALIRNYLSYARTMAAKLFARRSFDDIAFEEYDQWAQLAVVEAVDRFDPSMGAQFRTFASKRIIGAILDGLERSTERLQQHAVLKRLRAQRVGSLLRGPESPASTEVSNARVLEYIADVGLGLAVAWMLEGTGMIDNSEAAHTAPFYRDAETRETRRRLLASVKKLPMQQSHVITLHYLQGQAFEEIARSMHLTKGRISQIHKQALMSLRAMLAGLEAAPHSSSPIERTQI